MYSILRKSNKKFTIFISILGECFLLKSEVKSRELKDDLVVFTITTCYTMLSYN